MTSTNYSTAVMLFNTNIRAVRVSYEPSTKDAGYIFKTLDSTIAVDDYVVVPTDTRWGYTVCKVVDVDVEVDFEASMEIKWLVDKVNTLSYLEVLAKEAAWVQDMRAAQVRKKREELKKSVLDMYEEAGVTTADIVNMSNVPVIEASKVQPDEQ